MTERKLWNSPKSPALGLAVAAVATLLAAACADVPVEPEEMQPEIAEEAPSFAMHLTCTVDVTAESMDCDPSSPSTLAGGPSMNLIVGSQHRFVRMANAAPSVSGGVWSANVTVQNLTLQPMGTLDGTTAAAEGVRVFFVNEPSNGVVIANHDGAAAITGSEPQKYYAYAGTEALGPDGILVPGEKSGSRTWQFTLNDATEFTFDVLISTMVPDPSSYAVRFTNVRAGGYNTCADGSDGKVYCWGWGRLGVLGTGPNAEDSSVPVPVRAPEGVTLSGVSVSGHTACAKGSDGRVYCWGRNNDAQLGNGGFEPSDTLTAVSKLPGVELSGLSLTDTTSCAEGSDDEIYCWGLDHGMLGTGTNWGHKTTPVQVRSPNGVVLTRLGGAGSGHFCADGSNGKVYCWGGNSDGQLGDGSESSSKYAPVAASAPGGVKLSGVQAGVGFSCALDEAGQAYCWGRNQYGQLGDGTKTTRKTPHPVSMPDGVAFSRVAVGEYIACGEGTNGRLYCWGDNIYGLLVTDDFTESTVPVEISTPGGMTLTDVSIGDQHACARSTAGQAYCWGWNGVGQLGDGTKTQKLGMFPVAGSY